MWRNYLRVGIRNLFRHRINTLINMVGLASGIAVCLLIAIYLQRELTWNHHLADLDRTYRVIEKLVPESGDPIQRIVITSLLRPQVEENIPGVQEYTRAVESPLLFRLSEEKEKVLETGYHVDPNFFHFFGFSLLEGDVNTVLDGVDKIVLTESFARKYFPDGDAMGQMVLVEMMTEESPYTVTGIIPDPPSNSSFRYDFLLPYEVPYYAFRSRFGDHWRMAFAQAYIKLEPGIEPSLIEGRMHDALVAIGEDKSEMAGARSYLLQPVRDIHMAFSNPRDLPTEETTDGPITLFVIGVVILLIACINFTTLMVGQSTTRAREVGVRKVLGSGRKRLMLQFWTETGLLTAIAMVAGVIGAELLQPLFNDFTQRTIDIRLDFVTLAVMAGLWLLIVFTAGFYPALVISGFTPHDALRGEVKLGGRTRLRQSLLFIQYSLSIALITATLLMGNQLRYVLNYDLGYNSDRIIAVEVPDLAFKGTQAMETMKLKLADNPRVECVAGSACNFQLPWMVMNWLGEVREYKDVYLNIVDANFGPMLGLQTTQGHFFRPGSGADSTGIVVNQAMVDYMEWDDPIGERLPGEGWPDHEVIGVVDDFHYSTMHEKVHPLVLIINPLTLLARSTGIDIQLNQWYTIQMVMFQLAPGDVKGTIEEIRAAWEEALPGQPFEFSFIDDTVQERYENDQRWIAIVTASSSLAILIALLGLLGLTGLEVARRTREIGIRKVLGASGQAIVLLLTKPMLRIVILANIVAWPVAWYTMRFWNSNFAYQAPIASWTFLAAGMGTFAVSLLVAGVLAFRASLTNPAQVLKVE